MDDTLVQGEERYGISWKDLPDYHYDISEFKNFAIIATPGTKNHLPVDYVANGNDDLQVILDGGDILYHKPLYLFVHGVVRVSLGDFGDKWDSGQCGFACITKQIASDFGLKPEEYENFLASAVKQYDGALAGNVFGYVVERTTVCDKCGVNKTECLDSCWGFLYDSVYSFVDEEVRPMVNQIVADFQEREDNLCRG